MYRAMHRVGIGTLCFAVKYSNISINILYLIFYGGLLCVKN